MKNSNREYKLLGCHLEFELHFYLYEGTRSYSCYFYIGMVVSITLLSFMSKFFM